ncbi:MAG TPA: hypothetical protein VHU92_28470 [Streptosporangiaceae bacterium]|jgi:hypothetical protein|nr:hypothetical protein [Streptosporangiaceae bacterium]
MNLFCRYTTQGRGESDRPHLSSRRVARLLLTGHGSLSDRQQALLARLAAACPEMTSLAALVRDFTARSSGGCTAGQDSPLLRLRILLT